MYDILIIFSSILFVLLALAYIYMIVKNILNKYLILIPIAIILIVIFAYINGNKSLLSINCIFAVYLLFINNKNMTKTK
jgi:hypothetical protein